MPHKDPVAKKAYQRAAYAKKRDNALLASGIDPTKIPLRFDGGRMIAIKPRKDSALPADLVLEMAPKLGETKEEHKRRRARLAANFYNSRMTQEQRAEKNARVRAAYALDAKRLQEKRKEQYVKDPERFRAYGLKYFLKHKDERLQKLADWRRNNPDKVRESREKWAKANAGLLKRYSADYRAQLADASPYWTDWDAISGIYEECAKRTTITEIEHVVDHIVPLNGKDVCGLHVWWNLRVITETLNCRKSNRWLQEEGLAPMQED
jgi:5-methylcytosine-specific restriction endonuclease McrA